LMHVRCCVDESLRTNGRFCILGCVWLRMQYSLAQRMVHDGLRIMFCGMRVWRMVYYCIWPLRDDWVRVDGWMWDFLALGRQARVNASRCDLLSNKGVLTKRSTLILTREY
jgi:hypothetical protein